jgi:hypothetical protein
MYAYAASADEQDIEPKLSNERVVFVIEQGEIEFAFFPEVIIQDPSMQHD